MKIKFFFFSLFLCLGLATATLSVTSCSAGGHIGPVGAGARVG